MTTLGGFMVNPALFLLGVAAIASPIIIHLLNKRKFKRIDWAAMDFLLEADKKNRRRVRLENLLLLLLRCLACILIGLLLARPFKSLGLTAGMFEAEEFERIVLLDDSLSMSVRDGSRSNMDKAKGAMVEFVRGLSTNGSKDYFTLYLTSDPTRPQFNAVPIDEQIAGEIAADIEEEVTASDLPARMGQALLEVEKSLQGRAGGGINRVVYIVSDMRQRDWPTEDAQDENSVPATLVRLAEDTAGCFVVDLGQEDDVGNLLVEEIRSKEKALVSGVQSQFEVTVRNTGRRDVNDAKVRFAAAERRPEESVGLEVDIPTVPAGETETVPFTYTFAALDLNVTDARPDPIRILAEVEASGGSDVDALAADNKRYFAARVVPGIRTLIVDGDPSAQYGRSESFFLHRALAPPGNARSGMAVDTVTDVEFETTRLDEYQVIYLCNLYRIPEERRDALEKWVAAGGGLVVALGDQLDEELYNRELYRDGKGLLPVKLDTILGDEEEEDWVQFNILTERHPVVSVFVGEGNPFIEAVKIFRWWECLLDEEALAAGRVDVAARFDNPDRSPAVVEKQFGDGRVLVLTTPLDLDWSNWPQDHSFPVTMLEMNRYMARKTADQANAAVGDLLSHTLDLTDYDLDVSVQRPDSKATPLQANPAGQSTGEQVLYRVDFDEVDAQGFYEMVLNRRDAGGPEPVLFAANIDPREGELARADTRELTRKFGDANVEIVSQQALLDLGVDNTKGELWRWILLALVVVLAGEQVLGWLFGKRR